MKNDSAWVRACGSYLNTIKTQLETKIEINGLKHSKSHPKKSFPWHSIKDVSKQTFMRKSMQIITVRSPKPGHPDNKYQSEGRNKTIDSNICRSSE